MLQRIWTCWWDNSIWNVFCLIWTFGQNLSIWFILFVFPFFAYVTFMRGLIIWGAFIKIYFTWGLLVQRHRHTFDWLEREGPWDCQWKRMRFIWGFWGRVEFLQNLGLCVTFSDKFLNNANLLRKFFDSGIDFLYILILL